MQTRNDFSLPFKVRDYECDMQGIVNNSVYMNYLEHARHEYLNAIGLNFKSLLEKDIYLVVIQAELNYKKSLQSGQKFTVTCKIDSTSRFKIYLMQEIYNEQNEIVLTAKITAAAINKAKKPVLVESFMS